MAKKRILVLTDQMPWGHRSIAKAIFSYLDKYLEKGNYKVYYREIAQQPSIGGDFYTFIYRYFPASNIVSQKLFTNRVARDLFKEISVLNLSGVKKEVEKIKPDLIISAYFFHTHTLVKWREKDHKKFKLWTVVADPWTSSPISFNEGCDLHIVYDEIAKKLAMKYDIKENRILKTGWWVRPEMYKNYDRQEARKKIGFNDNRPVIFVGGGSLGTTSLIKLLPIFLLLKKKVGFIINTGTDKNTYNLVNRYIRFYKKIKRDNNVIIKNFGWIDNIAEVLEASDIVFGKAGPNFLFDSVACQKPFVAITHVGGQEDGNIELIKKKKLGWIREKSNSLSKFLYQYLDDPKYYENKFKETIKKEADNNKNSLKVILERVKKDLL